jgi:hypothetical protein
MKELSALSDQSSALEEPEQPAPAAGLGLQTENRQPKISSVKTAPSAGSAATRQRPIKKARRLSAGALHFITPSSVTSNRRNYRAMPA